MSFGSFESFRSFQSFESTPHKKFSGSLEMNKPMNGDFMYNRLFQENTA